MRSIVLSLAALLLVGACAEYSTQTSSGAEYLARYEPVSTQAQPVVQRTVQRTASGTEIVDDTVQTVSTDEPIRHAAAIEPLLRLPARIGLARIEAGRLTAIPAGESALWTAFAQRHAALGGFAAIDPFLADYTLRTVLPQDQRALRRDASDVVTMIRLGAARQHMDAVLIYEVGSRERRVNGIDGLAPIGLLGAAPLPAAPIEKEGVARAFLMDVRNGYPYGAASASVDLVSLDRPFWSDKPQDALGIEAKTRITRGLVPEVEKMVGGVLEAMAARTPPAS
ncbi:MAG TPA: hypothetical protein VMY41_13965 [Thermohalobaculum sp.]|nr:hypothetical protein [Thermohalobaculum sp.]